MRALRNNDFARHVATLATGTAIANAIPIAISPILTRLYTPEDFGVFALFAAITSILATISSGRYELAIMVPSENEDALRIAALSLMLGFMSALIILFFVIVFGASVAGWLGSPEIENWLYLLPIATFIAGVFNILSYTNSRLGRFSDIAVSGVVKSVLLATLQISLGLLKFGAGGLIFGQVISSATANLRLLRNSLAGVGLQKILSLNSIRRVAREFLDFPKYSLPSALANVLAANLTIVLFSRFYTQAAQGQYSLTYKVLAMPATLIGNSIGQVFYQRASVEKRERGSAQVLFASVLVKLSLISLTIFGFAYLIVEDAFAFVFGEQWRQAGEFARILIPFFAIKFVVSPLSLITQVNRLNRLGMRANIILLLQTAGLIVLIGKLSFPPEVLVSALAAAGAIFYGVFLLVIFRKTRTSQESI